MTVREAEDQYQREVEDCIEQHKRQLDQKIQVLKTVSFVCLALGVLLTAIGFSLPPKSVAGYEYESSTAYAFKTLGILALCFGAFLLLMKIPSLRKSQEKGPDNFLPQMKNLYLNYLICEDLSASKKEVYRQKLEDLRNEELTDAMHNTNRNTLSKIILFRLLRK